MKNNTLVFQADETPSYGLTAPSFSLSAVTLPPAIQNETPGRLRFKGATECSADIAGVAGTVVRDVSLCDGIEISRERFLSGDGSLAGIRLALANRRDQPIELLSLTPFMAQGARSVRLSRTRFSDWRVFRMARHKNDVPGAFHPARRDGDFCDALFQSGEHIAGLGISPEEHAAQIRSGRTVHSEPCVFIRSRRHAGRAGLFIALLGQTGHLSDIALTVTPGEKALESLRVNCEFDGAEVAPGETRETHWLLFAESADEPATLAQFAEMLAREYSVPLPPKPETVYCSWYFYGMDMSERHLEENLACLAKDPVPFDVLLIDSCWIDTFGAWNANVHWPGGMANAARLIREAGFKPGIWTCPFIVMADSPILTRYPQIVARDSQGNPCPFGYRGPKCFTIDPTADCAEEYLSEFYGRLKGWGFTHHKLDFLRAVVAAHDIRFQDRRMTRAQAYRRGMELVRKALGPESYILACGGLFEGSLGLVDGMRSGSDVTSDWKHAYQTPERRLALIAIKQNLARNYMNRFWHTDPDALMLRLRDKPFSADPASERLSCGSLTDEEAFTAVVNQYLGGGMVCLSERFAELQTERRALLRHVIPPAAPPARPLDLGHPDAPSLLLTRVQPDCAALGEWWTLAVANWQAAPARRRVRLSDLGLPAKISRVAVFEFRTRRFMGIKSLGQTIQLDLPGHGVRLLRLAPWDGSLPVILGTDLHLTGGACELAGVVITARGISGKVRTRWKCPATVFAAFPTPKGARAVSALVGPGESDFNLS